MLCDIVSVCEREKVCVCVCVYFYILCTSEQFNSLSMNNVVHHSTLTHRLVT